MTIEKYKALCNEVNEYSDSYYNKSISLITDQDFDKLYKEVQEIEKSHPEWVDNDSPTRRVGAPISGKLPKVKHSTKLYSLDNVFSIPMLENFLRGIEKTLHRPSLTYDVEMKYDGLTCVAIYTKGVLNKLVTRGDGVEGEDVSHNRNYVKFLPAKLEEEVDLIVKGEVLMTYEDFEFYNKLADEHGVAKMSNPRNAASGLLRRTTGAFDRAFLTFIPYDCIENEYTNKSLILNQITLFNKLRKLGFGAYYFLDEFRDKNGLDFDPYIQICDNSHMAKVAVANIHAIRDKLPFPIDGAVIKVNEYITRFSLGYTDKAPRGAIAYKFPPEEVTSELLDIILQVGRLGTITPVAKITPVEVNGVVVSNVTLHNEAFIKEKDLRIGDKIVVTRRGDVIPHIEYVLYDRRTEELPVWEMPKTCPSCGSDIVPYLSYYMCVNILHCPDQKLGRLEHFVSKQAMNIEGLAKNTLKLFLDNKLIDKAIDLYSLDDSKLLTLEGFGDKSLEQLKLSLKNSISRPLDKFIYAIGIEGVGQVTARKIAKKFISYENFRKATREDLISIPDVGPIVSNMIVEVLDRTGNEIDELAKVVRPSPMVAVNSLLSGKTFCFTGSFGQSRENLISIVEKLGGEVLSSVSKNLNYLIVGVDPGSKLSKAKKLNIPTKDIDWLLSFLPNEKLDS